MRDHKSLEQLAKEEGCKISTLHTRLHFLVKKLESETEKQKEREEGITNVDKEK